MVEQTIRDIAASVQVVAGGEIITGGGGGPFPTSGIWGWVKATGDGASPAYLQLLNPPGSGVTVKVYELYASFKVHATSATCYGIRTDSPVTLSSPMSADLQHLDEADVTAIEFQLLGGPGGAVILEADGQYIFAGSEEGQTGWKPFPIIGVGEAPLVIPEGSAFELSADSVSAVPVIPASFS